MTTLEPEKKDILEKLNQLALEENWGTVDRDPNGIPKGVAVVMEAMQEIKRLRELPKKILKQVDYESNGQTVMITNFLRKKYGVEIENE